MVVVALRPVQQRQHISGQGRFGIQHRFRRAQQGRTERTILGKLQQKADHPLPPEGRTDPDAGAQGRGIATRRRQIIKDFIQRRGNRDPQNQTGHGRQPSAVQQASAQPFEHELHRQRRQNHPQQPVDDISAGLADQAHQLRGQQQTQQSQ